MTPSNTITCETETPGEFPHVVGVRSHTFRTDAGITTGGNDTAPGAHDLFDAALAACKAHTAIFYAKRKGIPLERVHTTIERDDSEERSGKYRLRVHVTFEGPISDEQRAALTRAIGACPVHKLMTTSDVEIEMV